MHALPRMSALEVPAVPAVDSRELSTLDLASLARAYREADPFPHAVLDGLFPEAVLRAVVSEIRTGDDTLEKNHYGTVSKHRISDISRVGPVTRRLIEELNSAPFLNFLQRLTGIEALVPDPLLEGGGVHQIGPGGFLKVHTDFNWHRVLQLHRRINVLIYLNEVWDDAWNGHLQLWDETMERCGAKIAPLFNRMVVFSTTDKSYHGHPDPLACPEDVRRNSIALYYYTATRPEREVAFDRSVMTNYRERPDERFNGGKLKHRIHQALIRHPRLRKVLKMGG